MKGCKLSIGPEACSTVQISLHQSELPDKYNKQVNTFKGS